MTGSLVLEHLAFLEANSDSLVIDPRGGSAGTVFAAPDGSYYVADFQGGYKWVEYGSDGELLAAPGRKGDGPGEFNYIRWVAPGPGGGRLVFEGRQLSLVDPVGARRRTHLFETLEPLGPRSSTLDDEGVLWLTGPGSYPEQGLGLASVSPSGEVVEYPRISSLPEYTSGYAHWWEGDLWVWEYPRGPFHRIDRDTGEAAEAWQPFPDLDDGWRAFPGRGPHGSMLFNLVLPGNDEAISWLVVFDADRTRVSMKPMPDDMRGIRFLDSTRVWIHHSVDRPVSMVTGIDVFRLRFEPEGGGG